MRVRWDKPRRYRNEPTVVDGVTWDSHAEANHYLTLKLRLAAGEIRDLRWHVKYPLVVNGHRVTSYTADFVYEEKVGLAWQPVIEDTKSEPTRRKDAYRIKNKLMHALGYSIREVLSTYRHKYLPYMSRHK